MASPLTPAEVDWIATLARLALSEEEKARLAAELGRILEFAGQISSLDTTGVPTTAAFLGVEPTEREDTPRPSLPLEEALANAPETSSNLFTVPRVPGREQDHP